MSDYFDRFEQSVGSSLERGAHQPWYSRAWRVRHGRVFLAVFGALAIGTPAGAVSDCFGACAPPHVVQASSRPGQGTPQLRANEWGSFVVTDARRRGTPGR